jgi:hypothetical protein
VNPLFVTCVTVYLPAGSEPPPSLVTSCTPTKCNCILRYLLPLSSVNLPYTCFSHSTSQISCPFSLALVTYPKNSSRSKALCDTLEAYFLRWGLVTPMTNPQSGGPPLVGHSWLLIQYICSYPPYPQAVSSICNLRACHNILTRIHLKCWCSLTAFLGFNHIHCIFHFNTMVPTF